MNSIAVRVFIALVAVAALCAANSSKAQKPPVAVTPPLAAAVDKGAKWLASVQGADGGWAQLRALPSDAYATGVALYALRQAGSSPKDAAYQRGVRFLLSSQRDDGSWYVPSRSPKVQPYFQSGFPHNHDQWISAAATSWATAALAEAVEPARNAASLSK